MDNAQTQSPTTAPPKKERTFMGQPWGLANLFGVEMWERFSFYGMQAILAYYMYYTVTEGGLGMDKAAATSIVGAYGGMVFLASIAAALVADKLLGSERTLFWSAVLVMVGHISLAIIPAVAGLAIGLFCIAIGSGGVKTNAQVVLGNLYSRTDPRRDAGFSIFYLGINIGALFGPLLTGWLQVHNGFHWGFGAAAVGMAIGLTQYTLMRKDTIGHAGQEVPNPLPKKHLPAVIIGVIVLVAAVVMLVKVGVIKVEAMSTIVAIIAAVGSAVIWFQMYNSHKTGKEEKSRLIGFIPIWVGSVLFFSLFQQQFTVLAIYADTRLNRNFFGFDVPASWVQSINPVFIIMFATVFANMWTKLGNRQWSTAVKFGVANMFIGLGMFVFIPFAGGADNSTPFLVIVLILFIFTMSELLLSPIGNSVATKLAPRAFQSQMFACWLMSIAVGTALAGTLAGHYNPESASAERSFFIAIGVAAIVLGLVMIAIKGWILKKFIDVR